MKRIIHKFTIKIIIISSVFLSRFSVAQDIQTDLAETKMYKNAIYAGIGIGGLYLPLTLYYERMLKQNIRNSGISSFVKIGIGSVEHWEGHSDYVLGQFGILTGTKKRHFEASIGVVYFYRGDMYNGPQTTYYVSSGTYYEEKTPIAPLELLSGSIGYRFQKPGGHYVFRSGIGWPEAVYCSWGFSF